MEGNRVSFEVKLQTMEGKAGRYAKPKVPPPLNFMLLNILVFNPE